MQAHDVLAKRVRPMLLETPAAKEARAPFAPVEENSWAGPGALRGLRLVQLVIACGGAAMGGKGNRRGGDAWSIHGKSLLGPKPQSLLEGLPPILFLLFTMLQTICPPHFRQTCFRLTREGPVRSLEWGDISSAFASRREYWKERLPLQRKTKVRDLWRLFWIDQLASRPRGYPFQTRRLAKEISRHQRPSQ